jgi:hypothetical protein
MANEQRRGESLKDYRERLNREFEEKYPRLAKLSTREPWDESVDIFLEAVNGEKLERRRES